MNLSAILLVGAGGFAGSISRYLASRALDRHFESVIPYGTFAVNVMGSFILGLVYAITVKRVGTEHYTLLLGVGFCGGFTTFSSFALENLVLLQQRNVAAFVGYSAFTFLLCLAAVALGAWFGNKI
jgi:CrcB protein